MMTKLNLILYEEKIIEHLEDLGCPDYLITREINQHPELAERLRQEYYFYDVHKGIEGKQPKCTPKGL